MPQGIDDFTIILSELTDMAACELKVYDGFDRLWGMVERYKMTAPIGITGGHKKMRCIRAIRGTRNQGRGCQLHNEKNAATPHRPRAVESPLTLDSKAVRV